ncbi:TIGR02594 family protein [Gayadomonas joobiniege]|uniref:NlpC/P60 family protein n=1 Tax=Gayadomonas joobiniege TaxID=1234606 RepID=UPI000367C64F|nr:TIGR02594 family protein [Gayadomonas joobiniege]
MNIRNLQQALTDLGFDPGPIDGIPGRRTRQAIIAFQSANSLLADGIVGPQTRAVINQQIQLNLQPDPFQIPVSMPWMFAAHNLLGTQEQPGRGSNEAIIGWAQELEMTSYDDDDIPWCGLFVAHCIAAQLPYEALPNNPLGARQWQHFGHSVTPRFGSLMVFWRGSRDGWQGHVGFYWAEDEQAYQILGGNQSNAVTITRIAKNRLIDARWPTTGINSDAQIRIAANNGKLLSMNEA